MKILQQVIGLMNKEEVRHFKLFINRTNASADRKDALLFDYIRKSPEDYDEGRVLKKLYSSEEKNALYRLKNRLLDDIGRSIALQYFDVSDYNYILNNLALSRLFQSKSQTKIAFFYLGKAEKKATELENFELLDLIYSEFVRLSHETLEINPEEYIAKRKENRIKLSELQEIDDILAAVIYRVKTSQNFSSKDSKILDLLQKTIKEFAGNTGKNNSQLRFKIYHAVSRILLQQQDYPSLEKYLLKTYKEFSKEGLFNKNNHDDKLQMLTYLTNSLFKSNKIDLSLEYAQKLKDAMDEFDGVLHDKYLFYYYNSLFINYAQKDLEKAIDILNEAKNNPVIKALPVYIVFIYLNLAVANFEKKNFKEALKNLVRLLMEDRFKNLDTAFQFKIGITELMIRYELGDFDYLEHKILQMKKDFATLLSSGNYAREASLIDIISMMMYSTTSVHKDVKLSKRIAQFIQLNEEGSENDIINYKGWLKSKMN